MRNKVYSIALLLVMLSVILLACSFSTLLSDPGDGNGSIVKFTGCIKSPVADNHLHKNRKLSGTLVVLRPSHYRHADPDLLLAVKDTAFISCSTVTDQQGVFHFDSVHFGNYSIEAVSYDYKWMLLVDSIDVNETALNESCVVDIGTHLLAKPQNLTGTIPSIDTAVAVYAFILGTDRFTKVDSTGFYSFDSIPAGVLRVQFLATSAGYISDTIHHIATQPETIAQKDTLHARVFYDGNGNTSGAVPIDSNRYRAGSLVTVASNAGQLIKGTLSFTGWDTIPNGDGRRFSSLSMFKMQSDTVTLYAQYSDSLVMDIDGHMYHTVTIGNQVWMRENFKSTRYNDGTVIPLVRDSVQWQALATGARCWYNNDSAAYHNSFGILYNWYSASSTKLAPPGWHVPSDSEWDTLVNYLGGVSAAGGKMKIVDSALWQPLYIDSTNNSGFSAVPAGCRDEAAGSFMFGGQLGKWWCTSDDGHNYSWFRGVRNDTTDVRRISKLKIYGASIRCVRD